MKNNTMVGRFLKHSGKQPELLPKLYGLIAERIRTRMLAQEEAEILAAWFDRLAAGEPASKVFPKKRAGRPRGTTKRKSGADDFTIAWIVRAALEARDDAGNLRYTPGEVYKGVAKAHGMSKRSVENLYSKLKHDLGPSTQ